MDGKRMGERTLLLPSRPALLSWAGAAGRREGEGPLGGSFDLLCPDDTFGQDSWEKAEREMLRQALCLALEKAGMSPAELDLLFAGDLLNQCVSSSFAARELRAPYLGLYGACSTMGEALLLAALTVDGGYARRAGAATCSHFCTAERQYRTPLEYGCQRPPTAQWTVTGAGAVVLGREGDGPRVTHVTPGRVVDLGITDTGNMGAAMAPAAHDTLTAHFRDTGRRPEDYDLILTGDLGELGSRLLRTLFIREGTDLTERYTDCGLLIYDRQRQDVHCGGSGCGCSASVLACHILPGMAAGRWRRVLFCPTGALHSPTTALQGESVPGICHAVALEVSAGEGDGHGVS